MAEITQEVNLNAVLQVVLDNLHIPTAEQTDAIRLFHSRGQLYPECNFISIDWFEPVVLVTMFRAMDRVFTQQLVEALVERLGHVSGLCVVSQDRSRGANSRCELEYGELPAQSVAKEAGCEYLLNFADRQNIGYFMDMQPGRAWLSELAEGKSVLNLFAYTCSFSVAAIAKGAKKVVNLDMSKAALAQGQRNHAHNGLGLGSGAVFLPHNLMRSWSKLKRYGLFDLLIVDPPSRQPGSFVAAEDYPRILRRLPDLLAREGHALVCLNDPNLEVDWLERQVAEHCPGWQFVERLANRRDFPDAYPERALKMLVYK